jgi:hypothetical protein
MGNWLCGAAICPCDARTIAVKPPLPECNRFIASTSHASLFSVHPRLYPSHIPRDQCGAICECGRNENIHLCTRSCRPDETTSDDRTTNQTNLSASSARPTSWHSPTHKLIDRSQRSQPRLLHDQTIRQHSRVVVSS